MAYEIVDTKEPQSPSNGRSRIVSSLSGIDVEQPCLRQAIERGMFVEPEFLSREECDEIRLEMLRSDRATCYYRSEKAAADLQGRRTSRAVSISWRTELKIAARLEAILEPVGDHFGDETPDVERPEFLLYERGDYFGRHVDVVYKSEGPSDIRQWRLTAVIFLNDSIDAVPSCVTRNASSFEGGELVLYGFPEDRTPATEVVRIVPTCGLLVIFMPQILHRVLRVRWGTRCSIVTGLR